MSREIIIMGLQKSAVVLHALAFQMKDEKVKKETLALVDAVTMAITELEKP